MTRITFSCLVFVVAACGNPVDHGATPAPTRAHDSGGEGEVAGGEGEVAGGEGEGEGQVTLLEDDAAIVDAQFPATLVCGQPASATVTVQNLGAATWTADAGYRLGAVDDFDPFAPGRFELDESVPTNATHTFTIPLLATAPGMFISDWRMVHENIRWFGATTVHDINVDCPTPEFDLSQVTILNSPDVSTWPTTAKITTLDLQANGARIDFTKRDGDGSWPDVPFGAPGDSLEYTLWIVLDIGGHWYASGCIEYWRGLDRNGGPPSGYAENWYYDSIRWGPMVGYQPAVGEQVGFMVTAGDARNNGNAIAQERSNVVFVPFPDDAGAVFTF